MKLVIDISKDDYDFIKNTSFVENTEVMFKQSAEDRTKTMILFRIVDAIKRVEVGESE